MKINLHIHSNNSLDGECKVSELIDVFENNGFDIISFTDHDTCDAYKSIVSSSKMKIVAGVEADAIANNRAYDFLCYDFNIEEVSKYVEQKYGSVEKRQTKIFKALVEKCKEQKIILNDDSTYNPQEEYAHTAIFRMLDEDFLNQYEIFSPGDLYRVSTIDKEFPLYIDMHIVWPDIKELVEVIHKNNGKVFIAHPYRYNKNVMEVLNDVKDYIDGVEISNNPKSAEEVELLYKFAKDNKLLVSCGSDYHGNDRYSMECKYLTEEMIADIVSWIRK